MYILKLFPCWENMCDRHNNKSQFFPQQAVLSLSLCYPKFPEIEQSLVKLDIYLLQVHPIYLLLFIKPASEVGLLNI